MADIAPFHFNAGNVDITLTAPAAPQSVGLALVENHPFPADAFQDGAVSLGGIKAAASEDFKLGEVKFSGKASGFAGLGVYRQPAALLKELKAEGLDEPIVSNLTFPDNEDVYALRWGYGLSGAVSGSIAFGPTVTFGGSARKEGLYALLRSLDRTTNARDAVGQTINSWKMPRQVSRPEDLQPGTWLIAETEGEVKLSLGVAYGYNYNWVRESLSVAGLTGDLGFKIEVGINAQLGFNASGRYALALCRETDKRELRLQIFRLREQGWSFAINAGVSAQAQQNLIPPNFDDFIKGVFNVNGLQALKDIGSEFAKWTDPDNKLSDLLGAKLIDYANDMVKHVTGFDPATDLDSALNRLREPIARWNALPHELTTVLYDFLRKETPLDDLRQFLDTIVGLADSDALVEEITRHLRAVNFFDTVIGKWLIAAAEDGILSVLANIDEEKQRLLDLAEKTRKLLDGATVEETLTKLQDWIETHLGLDKILAISDELSFSKIDKWLKERLSNFLGKTVVFADLEKIKAAINKLRGKADAFYAKGYKALMDKYQADFHFLFQKTTTRTALIDVTFDFDVNAANGAAYLAQALNGDFTRLLNDVSPTAGVKLNKGVLTHEIKRRTHIDASLPFSKKFVLDHINESLANAEVVDTADGRLWIFKLKAQDVVSMRSMMSKLSVAMQLTGGAGVREFSKEDYKFNYALRLTKHDARTAYLEDKLGFLTEKYLSSEFSGNGQEAFPAFVKTLDGALDERGITGEGRFGNMLVGLDVSVPSAVLGAWKKVPATSDGKVYKQMSLNVQELLRTWIPFCYLQEPQQFDFPERIYPLLAYCSLPAINRVRLSAGQLKFTDDKVLDWDYRNDDLRNLVLGTHGAQKLRNEILPQIRDGLSAVSQPTDQYDDNKIGKIIELKKDSKQRRSFEGLMLTESELITGIHHAGIDFRKFLDANNLEVAADKLANFGSELTDSLNNKIGNAGYESDIMRSLGSLLFMEVSKLFDPSVANLESSAMLEILVLKNQSSFVMGDYLKGVRPEAADLAFQQHLVSVGSSAL